MTKLTKRIDLPGIARKQDESISAGTIIAKMLETPTRRTQQGQPFLSFSDQRQRDPIIKKFELAGEENAPHIDLSDADYKVVVDVFNQLEFTTGEAWIRTVVNAVADASPIKDEAGR